MRMNRLNLTFMRVRERKDALGEEKREMGS